MFVINVEILRQPPLTQKDSLEAPCHELIKQQDNCRIYKLTLSPGQSTGVISYRFFSVRVVLKGSLLQNTLLMNDDAEDLSWTEKLQMGDSHWKEPSVNMTITNIGDSVYEAYICEFI